MNKLISTLFCGALALATVSAQDIAPKYFKLKTEDGKYLVLAKSDNGKDSTIVVAADAPLAKSTASLWGVVKSDRDVSGNYAYKFTSKTGNLLKVDDKSEFAVGEYSNVKNGLDTIDSEGAAEFFPLFYAVDNAGKTLVADAANNNLVSTVEGEALKLALEIPASYWLTTSDLNEGQEYIFDFLSTLEGTDSTFLFNVAPGYDNDVDDAPFVFNIKSNASGKYFAVDSVNWTKESTVNIVNQQPAFGFNLTYASDKAAFKNFGIYYDPSVDAVAIAVIDSTLAWSVVEKEIEEENVESAGKPVAFVGYAKFIKDSVPATVDLKDYANFEEGKTAIESLNGVVYWVASPKPGEAVKSPFGDSPYVITKVSSKATENGRILGIPYSSLCMGENANFLPKENSTVEPENQWYIKESKENGKFYYTIFNRFYGEGDAEGTVLLDKERLTKVDAGYILGEDTVTFTPVANPAGFKVFSDYELAAQKVKLNIVNAFGSDAATLVFNDTLVVGGEKNGIWFNVEAVDPATKKYQFPYIGEDEKALNENDYYGVYKLSTVVGNDTLYLGFYEDAEEGLPVLALSKYGNSEEFVETAFAFKSDTESAYKIVPVRLGSLDVLRSTLHVDICSSTGALRVHENGSYTSIVPYYSDLTSLFTLNYSAEFEYQALPAGHYTFRDESATSTGLDYLTKRENGEAKFLRVGDDLKAASIQSDFSLWVDSASVATSGIESLTPSYYILKGAEHFANGDSLKGNFLTVKGKYDELNDSINFVADTLKGVRVNDVRAKIKKESAFLFRITNVDDVYEIVPFEEIVNAEPRRLALINGVVVSSSDKTALPVLVKAGAEIPVANENINAADAVKVYAEQGAVRVQNAAGKSVTISNILGQTVASTIITSDDATIAAPKGIVVVAVEGENAVKAIVK